MYKFTGTTKPTKKEQTKARKNRKAARNLKRNFSL